MKNSYLKYISVCIILSATAISEPSVYSRAVTYGAKSNLGAIYSLRQEVASLKEEVEGLKSIVESLSQKISQTPKKSDGNSLELQMLKERVEKLEAMLKVKKVASATESNLPKKIVSTQKLKPAPSKADRTSNANASIYDSVSPSKLYIRGVRLFEKKNYTEAKRIFENLLKRKYKSAATNFYLGEIAYRTGKYRDAIKYYQRSAELNENAAYMDKLLLHTGICLENDGDKEQANNFYKAIIDAYPGTSSARVAKKRLK